MKSQQAREMFQRLYDDAAAINPANSRPCLQFILDNKQALVQTYLGLTETPNERLLLGRIRDAMDKCPQMADEFRGKDFIVIRKTLRALAEGEVSDKMLQNLSKELESVGHESAASQFGKLAFWKK